MPAAGEVLRGRSGASPLRRPVLHEATVQSGGDRGSRGSWVAPGPEQRPTARGQTWVWRGGHLYSNLLVPPAGSLPSAGGPL